MKYTEFETIISPERMRKYMLACNNDSKRAMTLYRYNLKLSQEMFTMISCFEVALRNKIDKDNIRNRIAHHEPICFGRPICVDTTYTLKNYARMMTLFHWMGIDANSFLYGLDHVGTECGKIMCV